MSDIPSGYEQRAMNYPDEITADELFGYLNTDDSHTRYEAATAAYWVAQQRPDRLKDRLPDFIAQLPREPSTSPDGLSVQSWLSRAIAAIVAAFPEESLSIAVARLTSKEPAVRQHVANAIAITARGDYPKPNTIRYPTGVLRYLSEFVDLLDDGDSRVRGAALSALAAIGEDYPNAVVPFVERATEMVANESARRGSVELLAAIARTNPADVRRAVPALLETLETTELDSLPDELFTVLFRVAKHYPRAVDPARPRLRELADEGEFPRSVLAENVLCELRGADMSLS